MRAVVAEVQPVMKSNGFRKRGNAFNRGGVELGIVQVLHFQMGAFDPPGTVEIPGLRPNLYGQFIINLGIYVEDAWRLESIRFGADSPPTPKPFINEYDCQIRHRLADDHPRTETGWWFLSDPSAGSRISTRVVSQVLPWFDGLASRDQILHALESAAPGSRAVSGIGGPDRLLATRMRLALGETADAQHDFNGWVRDCRSRAADEPHTRGHLEYLAKFASQHGLEMID